MVEYSLIRSTAMEQNHHWSAVHLQVLEFIHVIIHGMQKLSVKVYSVHQFLQSMNHYTSAKASVHWTISWLRLSTLELTGWGWYTACSHEVRVNQACMNWSNDKNESALNEIAPGMQRHIYSLASWTNHVLMSWLMSQQKAIKIRTQDSQRKSL